MQDGVILPAWNTAFFHKDSFTCFGVLSPIINPLLTKLVWSRWLDVGVVLFS